MDIYDRLKEYTSIPGGSGYESLMAYRLKEDLEPLADEVKIDLLGNVIACFPGKNPKAPTVMLFAHMDQIGFVVTNIDQAGYLHVNKNGSVPDKVAPGLALRVRTTKGDYLPAVVSEKSYHVMTEQEKMQVTPIPDLRIDVGASKPSQVLEKNIQVGCSIVYAPVFERLLGSQVAATALDNRGSCLVLTMCAEALSRTQVDSTVYIVGTVQEEHNLRGAMVAAQTIKPDIAIALDVCLASNAPGLEDRFTVRTGGGPVINMYSFHGRGTLNGVIAHEGLARHMAKTAEEGDIPVGWFASRGLLTDATYVQNLFGGIATIDLAFPVKYAHSPCEVCDVNDLVLLSDLCVKAIAGFDESFQLGRY